MNSVDDLTPIVSNESVPSKRINLRSLIATLKRPHFMFSGLLVLVIAVTAAILLVNQQPSSQQVAFTEPQATVTLTSSGFVPAQLNVASGTAVTWVNDTSGVQAIGSAPYPSHATLPQLVSGAMNPHGTYSFTFNQPGAWDYQDDNNPLLSGSVIVSQ